MGNALYAPGKAQPKKHTEYKIVGKPIKREDVAPKVFAQEDYCTDIKVPGMVHGRMIRPAVAGSVPVKVDESSIKDIPGAKVVWDKGFLGVVADKEWDAIQAAEKLKVEWSKVEPPFPDQNALYDHIRKASGAQERRSEGKTTGNVDEAFKTAARVIEAEYEWPFQSHAAMGPACALVEIKDGKVKCWTGSQKSHFVQIGLAAQLGVPLRQCPRHLADRTGLLRPQRCRRLRDGLRDAGQGGRQAGAPAIHARAGHRLGSRKARPRSTAPARRSTPRQRHRLRVHQQGVLAGRRQHQRQQAPIDTLAGHTLGVALKSGDGFGVPAESYEFANKSMGWETIPPLLDRSSPLRTSHLRDPVGPQIHFASESFMDEVAAALEPGPDRVPAASTSRTPRDRR